MNKPMHIIANSMRAQTSDTDRTVLAELASKKALAITQVLQTTLDPKHLIELFSMEAGELIVHQGVHYINNDIDLKVKFGRQARHSCTYTLHIGDEPLGKLRFRRNERFTEAETAAIEKLLCSLLYPLRNALLHQDALQLAQKDPLTGVYNRKALDEMFKSEFSHAERHGSSCSLIMLDIDHFKSINDQYGHIIGDCALKKVASMISECKRDSDLLFRYGGEEFVILTRDTSLKGTELLAERIRRHIGNNTCSCSGSNLSITVSAGISTIRTGDTPISLLERADKALYCAKENGRNQVCIEKPDTR